MFDGNIYRRQSNPTPNMNAGFLYLNRCAMTSNHDKM
jgi:hypothetical protein